MNPHFIFNSLNSINRYIVKADSETASLYLTKFSRLIRLILDNSKNSRVILENELNAIRLYIEMEQIRFDHKFSYTIEYRSEIDPQKIEIPPMILQPYIENAIWHGLMGRESHGKLNVTIEVLNGVIVSTIEDNGIGREKSLKTKNSTGRKKSYGMQITSNRLDLLRLESKMESSVEIIDLKDQDGKSAGTRVIVKMPAAIHNRIQNIAELNS
jgi:LytS/YehU family sensor histidine kinase